MLLQAERRGRLSTRDVAARLELLRTLPIATDDETSARVGARCWPSPWAERLTTYDAAYLELALRKGAALATKGTAPSVMLLGPARRAGLVVLPNTA